MNKTIELNGVRVPTLGFGTYMLQGKACIEATEHALQIGYRHIDTAQFYDNEEAVGTAIKNSPVKREDIFLVTKVWPSNFSDKAFIPSVENSLKQLKLDYVDLLLIHWPGDGNTNKRVTDLLEKCRQLGYTRLTGVSNFNLQQLAQARTQTPVFCNQVEYHPFLNQEKMLQYTQQNNLLLTAYSPLALGKIASDPVILSLAKKHQRTAAQVTLRWLLQQKNVAAIPKAASEKHRAGNLEIFDFHLDEEDMDKMYGPASNRRFANPATAPDWDK